MQKQKTKRRRKNNMKTIVKYFGIALTIGAAFSSIAQNQIKLTSAMLGGYPARQIGPAEMSGRITALDAVATNPRILYVGTAGGGIWKSTNAGTTFKPIFDKYVQSIGCMVIDQKNPETIWVGTGESNMRNSVSVGTGMYKSTDGGSNWKPCGLDSTEHISKIAIDPNDPNIVYVAVPGPLWSNSKHRGLYKTTDGGKTWNKIYYVDDKTGCADVIIDPKNPNTIYMSMWQFRRTPWSFSSGGKGSGLFKSVDGGKTWKKIQSGFDGEELGRICLAISPSETKDLYAIAESKNTALYASTDGGETWNKKSATMNVTWRPFYFSSIMVDPVDPKRVYRPGFTLSISTDGGESWKDASFDGGWVHSDHHAIWINPQNNNHILIGTDGGVYQSLDKGNSWVMLKNLPVSQFYHVALDNQTPYNVYGGLQDNGSWYAPSSSPGGIENKDWVNCGGGDGFWVQPDGVDENVLYSESQGGAITRYNKKTGESKDVKPYPKAGEPKLRCNWNTPIVRSNINPKTIFYGAQYLYKTTNQGITWERISPDLTTNDPKKQEQDKSGGLSVDNSGAENHCTIFTICDSPLDENMIWVGTDDGNIQLTLDGGKTWSNLAKNIKGVPPFTWVSNIEASPYDKNIAFATFDGHAFGDMKTYVMKTSDMGKTWTSIGSNELKGFAHRIKQDPIKKDLLFLGTEFGLYMSIDGGKTWVSNRANIPPTPVRDIAIHKKTHDLVLATHGRGVIILDDIEPFRELSDELMNKDLALLTGRKVYLGSDKFGGAFPGSGYSGDNPSDEFTVLYYLKNRVTKGNVSLEIYDAANNKIASIPGTKRKGINEAAWNMRVKAPRVAKGVKIDGAGFFGPAAAEGKYKLKLIVNDQNVEKEFDLVYDPEATVPVAERKMSHETVMKVFQLHEDLAYLSDKLRMIGDTAYARADKLGNNEAYNKALEDWNTKSGDLLKTFAASIEGTAITGEEKIREKISELYFGLSGTYSRPTDSQLERIEGLKKEIADANIKANALFDKELKNMNAMLVKNGAAEIKIPSRDAWDKISKK